MACNMKPGAIRKSSTSLGVGSPQQTAKTPLVRRKSMQVKVKQFYSPDNSPCVAGKRGFSQAAKEAGDISPISPSQRALSHIRLPPLQKITNNFLPPTVPASSTMKPVRLHKRFSHMSSTLNKIPCEDFMNALLNNQPYFQDVLTANVEKCRRRCSLESAVCENPEDEASEGVELGEAV